MNLMICLSGEPEQARFLPEIAELGAGIELGSYGLVGIQSEQNWEKRFALHQAIRAQFPGRVAMHGPFIGMEFDHIDHLIREVVQRRMDMTFNVATKLGVSRVNLHSGYTPIVDLFNLQDIWMKGNIAYWQQEICRWADAGIEIVLENDTEPSPDLLIQLVTEVNHPNLGLCMDIGHQHKFSKLDAVEWVRRMGSRLYHIHLHDNDGLVDRHWPLGRGNIDFKPFYEAVLREAPRAAISLEVEDEMEVKMRDLRNLAQEFASNG